MPDFKSLQELALFFPYGHISLKVLNVKLDLDVSVAKLMYQTSKST